MGKCGKITEVRIPLKEGTVVNGIKFYSCLMDRINLVRSLEMVLHGVVNRPEDDSYYHGRLRLQMER